MPNDSAFQDLNPVQSTQQTPPRTIASATTVAPTTALTFITGAVAIVNITPPQLGFHVLYFWPLGAFTMTNAGNITAALTAAVGSPVILFFNPLTNKYHPAEIPVAA